MDTTNQNTNETPKDGESKLNPETSKSTKAEGNEPTQTENENSTEGSSGPQKPYIPKPSEDGLIEF